MTKTRLKKLFHLTPEEYNKIMTWQVQNCIYRLLLGKRNSLDHNHASGEVRGFLEWRLNRAYGMIERAFPKTVSLVLRALAEFHDNPPARFALGKNTYGIIGQARYKKKMLFGPPPGHREPKK